MTIASQPHASCIQLWTFNSADIMYAIITTGTMCYHIQKGGEMMCPPISHSTRSDPCTVTCFVFYGESAKHRCGGDHRRNCGFSQSGGRKLPKAPGRRDPSVTFISAYPRSHRRSVHVNRRILRIAVRAREGRGGA